MTLALLGLGLGLIGAFWATRLLSRLIVLYQVRATDPPTLIVASALLLVAASIACYLPARRAARIDPAMAMKAE
jgi:putative ABC transport system permease protein